MTEPEAATETANAATRRIRAFVRVLLSPVVWLVTLYQGGLMVLLRADVTPASQLVTAFLYATLFLGFFFLAAGTYRAFVVTRNVVSIPVAVGHARAAFSGFMLLLVKAGLLAIVVLNVVVVVGQGATGLEPEEFIKTYIGWLPQLVAVLAFVFVFWLPIVFVHNNFSLFATLRTAVGFWRGRFHEGIFLALLVLLPAAVLGLVPEKAPFALHLAIGMAGEILTWVAFVYCAEMVADAGTAPK
jgi:hypothetical protein